MAKYLGRLLVDDRDRRDLGRAEIERAVPSRQVEKLSLPSLDDGLDHGVLRHSIRGWGHASSRDRPRRPWQGHAPRRGLAAGALRRSCEDPQQTIIFTRRGASRDEFGPPSVSLPNKERRPERQGACPPTSFLLNDPQCTRGVAGVKEQRRAQARPLFTNVCPRCLVSSPAPPLKPASAARGS